MTNDGKNIRCAINYLEELKCHTSGYAVEWLDMAIEALTQKSITWIVGKDNCQVAVKNMPIDKMQKICAIIGEEEQQPCDDCVSRQAVLDKKELVELEDGQSFYCINPEDVETLLPVTPQRPKAKWRNWLIRFECTNCGTSVTGDLIRAGVDRFCPWCGAEMEGEE